MPFIDLLIYNSHLKILTTFLLNPYCLFVRLSLDFCLVGESIRGPIAQESSALTTIPARPPHFVEYIIWYWWALVTIWINALTPSQSSKVEWRGNGRLKTGKKRFFILTPNSDNFLLPPVSWQEQLSIFLNGSFGVPNATCHHIFRQLVRHASQGAPKRRGGNLRIIAKRKKKVMRSHCKYRDNPVTRDKR